MAMTLITTNTADDNATLSFTSGIDSTYKLYIFKFFDIKPASDGTDFEFNGSIDAGSNYAVTKTGSFFSAVVGEAGGANIGYDDSRDNNQQTRFQCLAAGVGGGSDESCAGELFLFNPSSTTYVKHWYARVQNYKYSNDCLDNFIAGYFNDTNDIDAIRFIFQSGNISTGTISMYGVG